MSIIKQSEIIIVWDILHRKNTGDVGYSDLDEAMSEVLGVEMDVADQEPEQPSAPTMIEESAESTVVPSEPTEMPSNSA